jgi:hypothetical protein
MKTMNRLFLVLMLSSMYLGSVAQFSKVIVFAPKGEKFTLALNGTRQNSEPEARVESDGPGGPSFKIKVTFGDPSIPEISKLVFNKPNHTFFYKVDKNAKGVYVLESTSSEWSEESKGTEKTASPGPQPASGGKKSTPSQETVKSEPDKGSGEKGCSNPMTEVDFAVALAGINAYPFEASRLGAAKKMAETHCLLVWEVKEVIGSFDLESSRLSFAKFAYDFTSNKADYGEVGEALHSTKSKTDLEKYIAGKSK